MKILINKCHGGLEFSSAAIDEFEKRTGSTLADTGNFRTNSTLIQIVEEMGQRASDKYSKIVVIEIPDDVDWIIEEYDGNEWVAEKHRTWYA